MKIGNKEFSVGEHTYIMGILNATPDSFSDGGKYHHLDCALRRVETMLEEGADIIDIGGESTRPGFEAVSAQEEIRRTVPIITAIKARFDTVISIDTYKAVTARAAAEAGADLINDVWGLQGDPDMAEAVALTGAACCLMHNRKSWDYNCFLEDMKEDLRNTVKRAKEAGISDEKIILDPGIGFAKNFRDNLLAIRDVGLLKELGYPILLAASRKSVIGTALDLPVNERVEGTLATTVIGVMAGCAFVRVHDVKENFRAIKMTEAIMGDRR